MRRRVVVLAVLAVAVATCAARTHCPNFCQGHGRCKAAGETGCTCNDGYTAPDCSRRQCPTGAAWVDEATAADTAHATAECSAMGICDRANGTCTCRSGFEGPACERMVCPGTDASTGVPCNGHGRCLTMAEAASTRDGISLVRESTYSLWDADKVTGCACDLGYAGYDCSLVECPKGDDPLTTVRAADPAACRSRAARLTRRAQGQVDEVQTLTCVCEATCSGSLYLTFRGKTTAAIAHGASAAEVETALEVRARSPARAWPLARALTTSCAAGAVDDQRRDCGTGVGHDRVSDGRRCVGHSPPTPPLSLTHTHACAQGGHSPSRSPTTPATCRRCSPPTCCRPRHRAGSR